VVIPEAKKWPIQEIARALDSGLIRFTQVVAEAYMCDSLRGFGKHKRVNVSLSSPTPMTNATLSIPADFVGVTWDSVK
jgi:hypothetical protein